MESPLRRPESSEYASYYGRYVGLVTETDILQAMERQLADTLAHLRLLPAAAAGKRYAPDKWTIAQVVGHMVDTERLFAFRALWFARQAPEALPGMEQDDWAAVSGHERATLAELASEFEHMRRANILMFRHLPAEAWSARGTASGNPFTVRSLAYMLVGHERHHLAILKERY